MKLKLIYSIITSLVTIASTSVSALHSKPAYTEDHVTITDISKPAFFTLQNTAWEPAPANLPPGATLAILEGDPKQAGPFTMRLKLPAHYEIPPHWCSMDEHISIISGSLFIGMGDNFDRTRANVFTAGSFARIPLKMNHYAWTTEETVIQLHGIGPWILGYVNEEQDPSKPEIQISADTVAANQDIDASDLNNASLVDPDREDLEEALRKSGRLKKANH